MSKDLIEMWESFLDINERRFDFLDIIMLSTELYPDLLDISESPECKYVCEILKRHTDNPVMKQLK